MTGDQAWVFSVLGLSLFLFAYGRWRYDIVALGALLTLVIADIIPADDAFQALGHPAVVTVAAVLVLSRGLQNSGVVDLLTRWFSRGAQGVTFQIARLTGAAGLSSGFINNVASMALLMPVAIKIGRLSGRPPSLYLMPLAFATLLGGLITLIGTPPNIIIATTRGTFSGETFRMFDFAPVGVAVAVAGILYLALLGWRLVPKRQGQSSPDEFFKIEDYITEVFVPEGSKMVGRTVYDLESLSEEGGENEGALSITVLDLVHDDRRVTTPPYHHLIASGDVLIIETSAEGIKKLVEKKEPSQEQFKFSEDETVVEAIVSYDSPLVGRSPSEMGLRWRYGVNVLAVARHGSRLKERLSNIRFIPGDILLLQGGLKAVNDALPALGCLPLAERGLRLGSPRRFFLSIGIFVGGIALATAGVLPVHVAIVSAAVAMVLARVVSLREAYASIDWPIIILLGAMIPVGLSLQTTGGTQLIVDQLFNIASSLPPEAFLVIVLIAAMSLSDVVNNAAAAVIMAPLSITVASTLGVSPDPFLMAVAVGASSSFLTPISHQSNTLAWRPGGYKFADYWRVGLPLEIVVVAVSVPVILVVWPLNP